MFAACGMLPSSPRNPESYLTGGVLLFSDSDFVKERSKGGSGCIRNAYDSKI
jgi:hypothetical protein